MLLLFSTRLQFPWVTCLGHNPHQRSVWCCGAHAHTGSQHNLNNTVSLLCISTLSFGPKPRFRFFFFIVKSKNVHPACGLVPPQMHFLIPFLL